MKKNIIIVILTLLCIALLTVLILISTGVFNLYEKTAFKKENKTNTENIELSFSEINEILEYFNDKYNNNSEKIIYNDEQGQKCEISYMYDFDEYDNNTNEIGFYISVGLNKINDKNANSQVAGSIYHPDNDYSKNTLIELPYILTKENYKNIELDVPTFEEIRNEIILKYGENCTLIGKY